MSDTNKNCNYCDSCNYCDFCDSCNSCNSCDSCNSCNSCDYCYYCDSCYYCVGLRMSERMLFCVGEGKYESRGIGYQKNNMVFNRQLTSEQWNKVKESLPTIKLPIATWVDKKDMTDDEKDNWSSYKQTGGFLKVLSYQDAWKKWWSDAKQEDKDKILKCEYFDADIFKKITGIEATQTLSHDSE